MSIKHSFKQSIYYLTRHNKDGSFATQRARVQRLNQIGTDLIQAGFKLRHIRGLKQKHIYFLVNHWKQSGLSPGTIKNRLSDLRWACEKFGRPEVVPNNSVLQVEKRQLIPDSDKSMTLTSEHLTKVSSPYIRLSLQLQALFGLRREEAMKIKVFQADKGHHLELQGSWAKNGRPRTVPIQTQAQRALLDDIKTFLKKPHLSLIPENKKYSEHLKVYEKQVQRAGIYHAHGLRHAYAQQCYLEFTGFPCPLKGGPKRKPLTPHQAKHDKAARLEVSRHLGHNRLGVTDQYLSR